MNRYLHQHEEFEDLLRILEKDTGIIAGLIEKDYWIMQVLYGLQKLNFQFTLKGGTSLSKGFGIINRFSEDIDIVITPPAGIFVNQTSQSKMARQSRKDYYDRLAREIKIDGIISVKRDHEFDDSKYFSGGIRLYYKSLTAVVEGLKTGILLEPGFAKVTPSNKVNISSWAYDKAQSIKGLAIINNTADGVECYSPGYTFVEKLQTIVTKYRQEQESGISKNYMR